MNKCLQKVIEEHVPNKKRLSAIKRAPSEKTRVLYEVRAQRFIEIIIQGGKVSTGLHRSFRKPSVRVNVIGCDDQ